MAEPSARSKGMPSGPVKWVLQMPACPRPSPVSAMGLRLTRAQARGRCEDAVIGDQRDTKPYRGCRDPAVGVVLTLAEGVADALALGPEARIGEHQLGPRVDRLGRGGAGFELSRPGLAPVASERTVAELGRRLERDERGPADDDRLVRAPRGLSRGRAARRRRQCRSLGGRGAAGGSRPQGGEEGSAFFDREVLDHHLAGWG